MNNTGIFPIIISDFDMPYTDGFDLANFCDSKALFFLLTGTDDLKKKPTSIYKVYQKPFTVRSLKYFSDDIRYLKPNYYTCCSSYF